VSWQHAAVIAIGIGLATGCAEHFRAIDRSASWSTGVFFWPPPHATSSWIAEPSTARTLGDVATLVGDALRRAGYADQRWFPIGVHCEHGFAVTTRLEGIDEDGTPKAPAARWLAPYPDAASLRWLTTSTETYLPKRGRYRVLLIAFTDLHVPPGDHPQRWDEGTAMEGPGMPAADVPARRPVAAGYRVGAYVYEYEKKAADGDGDFVPEDTNVPAAEHLTRSGLSLVF
jgi:hypothetical protein